MLKGKCAIVTGADQGFGKIVARKFLQEGADVCICSRNAQKLQETADELEQEKRADIQRIIAKAADISEAGQVDALYDFAAAAFQRLDIVVNNAGVQGPIGELESLDWKALEDTVQINLMGNLYSMRRAVAVFRQQGKGGRIINLSGGGAAAPRQNFLGYAITKTAIVRATETLARETQKDGIYINAVAPGAMNTRMLDQVLSAGEDAVGKEAYKKSVEQKENGGASMERAAQLVAYLASEASGKVSGKLISAVWDDWEHLHLHEKELQESDVYTLRRIVPDDRGMQWAGQ